jgi:indolepyruvate ferredoxin oxidoreductase alpha subunit
VVGKAVLPRAGEYTGPVLRSGIKKFLAQFAPDLPLLQARENGPADVRLSAEVPQRPPGFCTGCPERPIFTAMKMVQREMGTFHVSSDIGCNLFSILPPFHIGNTTMGYGLSAAGASAFKPAPGGKRAIAVMGDGGFWHNGLTSGFGNAVFNQDDNVVIVVDNGYSAATGGQDLLSSAAGNSNRSTQNPIEKALRGVGVHWVKPLTRTYDVPGMRQTLKDAMTTSAPGPKVIVAQSECMLNKQRRVRPQISKAIKAGKRVVHERFGVDPDTCTGDHSCIRLSGCPSLSVKPSTDPLRTDPVAHVDNSCVGCGLCGEISHAAVLCPSFYRAQIVTNPTRLDRIGRAIRTSLVGFLQGRAERALARRAF